MIERVSSLELTYRSAISRRMTYRSVQLSSIPQNDMNNHVERRHQGSSDLQSCSHHSIPGPVQGPDQSPYLDGFHVNLAYWSIDRKSTRLNSSHGSISYA